MYLVEDIVNYSVHAVCVDTYLVLGYPDRRAGYFKLKNINWAS